MAWSESRIFAAFVENVLENTNAMDLDSDTFKVALFNNSITPDWSVVTASTAFGAGVWAANEVYDGAEWATGGQAIDNKTSAFTSNVYKWDADDEVSAGTSATLANVFGCLLYDTTISSYGVCYLYFGGSNTVGGRVQVPVN